METFNCAHCDKEIKRHQYQINRNTTGLWFCSYECQRAYRKENATPASLVCPSCGNAFTVKPYRIRNAKKTCRPVTCSKECSRKSLGWGSKTIPCDWCGKVMNRKNAEIKKHNFCSRECMGKWQSKYMVGENSNSWRGGYEQYYGSDWEHQRRDALSRDGETCQCCSISENIEVHHIKPFRLFESHIDANRLSNLICLCRDCHVAADVVARRIFDENWGESEIRESLQNYSTVFSIYFDKSGKPS